MYGIQRRILSEKFRQQCGEMEAARTDSSGNTGKLFHKIKHCRFCGCDYDVGVIWLWTGDGNAVKKAKEKERDEQKDRRKTRRTPGTGESFFLHYRKLRRISYNAKKRFATRRRRESCGAGFYFCFTSFYFKL